VHNRLQYSVTESVSLLSDVLAAPAIALGARKFAPRLSSPVHLLEMLFLIEDKRFLIHFGVDPIAIFRAMIFNLRGLSIQGGSTIPQQLYKLGSHPRTLCFKIRQSAWAVGASLGMSKVEILRLYLEKVYWGRSFYGLDHAVRGYFGLTREGLSIEHSFFLAERIASPNRVSAPRIVNLLTRPAIIRTLKRYSVRISQVIELYDHQYKCGGDICHILEKSTKRLERSISTFLLRH
jgi:membrane peptidoglycan carboxypeptidase